MEDWVRQRGGGRELSKESANSWLVLETHLDGGRMVLMTGSEGSAWLHQLMRKMTRWRVVFSSLCGDRAEVKNNLGQELTWWAGWSSGQASSRWVARSRETRV